MPGKLFRLPRRGDAMNNVARLKFVISSLLACCVLGVSGQTCSPSTTPTTNGQKWAVPGINSLVYIDPTLPADVQAAIVTAVNNFSSQSGETVDVAPAGATVPDPTNPAASQGAIYMNNNPSGAPSGIASTTTTMVYANGQPTSQQINAVTSFNLSYQLGPNVPAYDPTGANASVFVQEVVMNELGHAFGLNDIPPGPSDYATQTPGASIMNGYVNTNDQGPHIDTTTGADVPGGVGSGGTVSNCDKKQVQAANPSSSAGTGGGGGGGGGSTPTCLNPLESCGTAATQKGRSRLSFQEREV